MDAKQQEEYTAFITQEKRKYSCGHVTDEERTSFEQERLLLRSFHIPSDIGPISAARGVLS
ncbi:hypothetical protein [Paenibacillus sinopodophylli]|uniref:hypothetical protein n=1 Tax=Paenibacillus sinopodophylli TaxID=1837342 RepID=UPI00110C971B|nr:hypothetical protein [Paenibacillus sinopodophylli]